jgi:hydroxymethylbilane synthase
LKKIWIAGTRGSRLALSQTELVLGQLRSAYPAFEFSARVIRTTGDTIWDQPIHLIGGKGLFVKEIEDALIGGDIDFAVHSAKDLPTELDPGLILGAVLEREDPRDVFLSRNYEKLAHVPQGGRIGTSSLRRKAQLLNLRPDLEIVPMRGNVDTRLRKLMTESLDGIVLAMAGVKRMGHIDQVKERMALDDMVPPSGQGAIGLETRRNDKALTLLGAINHEKSHAEVSIERSLQALIGGGCQIPLGINAQVSGGEVALRVVLGREDGIILFSAHMVFPRNETENRIIDIAQEVRKTVRQ